jgi:c-di-GMP-binding flagellar brake protein YcgR
MANGKDLSIHDDVTVETDLDAMPVSLRAFVTNVLAEELWLATKLPDERINRLQRGQGIHLTLDRDGPVILESTFLRRLGDASKFQVQKSRVFAVQRPAGVESSQRRAHVRVDLERAVRIRSMGSAGPEKLGTGRTINIGAGGVLFATSMPLLFGEELRLAIVLNTKDIVITGGSIVRIEDFDDEAPQEYVPGAGARRPTPMSRVAVRFDQVSEADQERITCYILQVHRQRRATLAAAAVAAAEAPAADETDGGGSDVAEGASDVAVEKAS